MPWEGNSRLSEHGVDAAVAAAVRDVRDRFGPQGLRDLIALATSELSVAEDVMQQLDDVPADSKET